MHEIFSPLFLVSCIIPKSIITILNCFDLVSTQVMLIFMIFISPYKEKSVPVASKNKKAQAQFDKFSYSHRKEYVEWITEAKTEPTRNKRLAITIDWLAEGKSRNWKYEKC